MKGIRLNTVNPGGAAEEAGLERGDVVIDYGGFATTDEGALRGAISEFGDGERPRVTIIRDGVVRVPIEVRSGALGVTISVVEFQDPKTLRQGSIRPSEDLSIEDREAASRVVITTAPTVGDRVIRRTIDIVSSEYVMGINVFGDIMTSVRDFVGGRSETVQRAMRSARESALDDLRAAAHLLGGNAVISVRIEFNEFSGKGTGMVMLAAYGTAVVIE